MAAQSVFYEVEIHPLKYKIYINFSIQIFISNNSGGSDKIIKSFVYTYNSLNSLAK